MKVHLIFRGLNEFGNNSICTFLVSSTRKYKDVAGFTLILGTFIFTFLNAEQNVLLNLLIGQPTSHDFLFCPMP